ncbi:hypothetical protein Leryth_004114 [Lithospermum erythrorhizon]|uniref:Late embryogenesis abundant protein LEA-2 subgroup domain-containing protein n=1 Tax=Lithospermum erythrorhizon TaxID=34254 RepID=A0AAV3PEE3_LITER|nr:hypothetical protein Leryth_004114 [Lithospermum erythrorhizon]
MVDREQIRPLATETEQQIISDDEEINTASEKQFTISKKRWKICCFCIAALFLIQAIVVITLIFTIFKVKDPIIRMNGVSINKFNLNNSTNMTITADVSVKNPNYASFKYANTTTSLFYHGIVVGEARGPPGKAKARRTMRMNVSVDIMTDRILSNPVFSSDLGVGLITMNSFTRVGGRVKMLKIIKRHVVVKMNCSIMVNVTTQGIQEQKCDRKVKL